MTWYERGDVGMLKGIPVERIRCFDVETTGMNPRVDEVLQLAVIDGAGGVLVTEKFGTERRHAWPGAQRVHGIAPADVAGKPSLHARKVEVTDVFAHADLLVGYNLGFDLSFLRAAGVAMRRVRQFDVMREFAPVAGRWNARRGTFGWVKLAECARHYGVSFAAHDALEDARATLRCFWCMLEDDGARLSGTDVMSYLEVVRQRGRKRSVVSRLGDR